MNSSRLDRRRFLSLLGGGVVAGAAASAGLGLPAVAAGDRGWRRLGEGTDLSGWETILGDGLYTAAGQVPVNAADVTAEHLGGYSNLRANIANRGVMAHVLSFKRFTDDYPLSEPDSSLMRCSHRADYEFRLPYLPSTAGGPFNAQTVEGGLFVWDGLDTRVDHGTAFQWVLNPWLPNYGQIQVWSDGEDGNGAWIPGGYLKPDTEWHSARFLVNPADRRVELSIDGTLFPAPYCRTPKIGWGTDVSARLQAEAISIWPGAKATWAPQHEMHVRNWRWVRKAPHPTRDDAPKSPSKR
ncbi:hypothetical protein [Couchioplanes caeruleus]|uniref:GH16 domain-containing protein n=2 Tax=Couchioplanes caeruleus TaxID=56438 RepID=A0A1K0FZM5_9ACTN|nr:hypothetical protein [Couchioplanes caeruleus]OJF10522.1 hypothetical protein BG844_31385 [Couchioplanes caeruleus subsp. caeruleus]ROP28615.1 hypothetical protein EDD30_1381 [Couchioplanes caeruleus]